MNVGYTARRAAESARSQALLTMLLGSLDFRDKRAYAALIVSHFWMRADRSAGPDACWPWVGTTNAKGYGTLKHRERYQSAHRFAFALKHGPIPGGLFVLHRCDNPPCVNPAHLFLGTNADNMADMVAKGRHVEKITKQQRAAVAEDYSANECTKVIAARYGISASYVTLLGRRAGYQRRRSPVVELARGAA